MVTVRETPSLVADRTISGRGVIKITPDVKDRHFWLYLNLLRLPRKNFSNSKYNPDKSEYAKITWIRSSYVLRENIMSYENQAFEWEGDPTGYIGHYLVCSFKGLNSYLDYLAPYIPAPPLPTDPTNRIYIEPIRRQFDTINIVCRSDTAVNAKLYRLRHDINCTDATPNPKNPPDPTPPSKVPTGTSIAVSPPYVTPNDGGSTIPVSGDTTGSAGISCSLSFDYTDLADASNSRRITKTFTATSVPVNISAPIYSNFSGVPNNSARKSDVTITNADGTNFGFNLINNSINGHTVAAITSTCT